MSGRYPRADGQELQKELAFHLIYYAGEAERLETGRWSFEREFKRNKWGTMKSVPLKRLGRNAEISSGDWVPRIKDRWSQIINSCAIEEGLRTRFTNDSNKKRGLSKAQTRYSPGRQALHKQGYFTDRDVEHNLESWAEWRRRKKAILSKMFQGVRAGYDSLLPSSQLEALAAPEQKGLLGRIKRCELALEAIDVLIDTAVHAAALRAMMHSGPSDVIAHYSDVEQTLKDKRPTPARNAKARFCTGGVCGCDSHLSSIDPTLSRLSEIESGALTRMKEAHDGMTKLLPLLQTQIATASELQPIRRVASDNVRSESRHNMSDRSRQALAAHLASGRGMSL